MTPALRVILLIVKPTAQPVVFVKPIEPKQPSLAKCVQSIMALSVKEPEILSGMPESHNPNMTMMPHAPMITALPRSRQMLRNYT